MAHEHRRRAPVARCGAAGARPVVAGGADAARDRGALCRLGRGHAVGLGAAGAEHCGVFPGVRRGVCPAHGRGRADGAGGHLPDRGHAGLDGVQRRHAAGHGQPGGGGLLQKNALPPALFPARAVLASAAVYLPLLLLLVPAYWGHHQGSAALLGLVPALLAQLLLAWLLGYLLAVLTAALRDVAQMMGFLLSIGVFAAPILFPLTMFPERWRGLLWLNPMTAWVLVYQSVLLQGQWPAPAVWLAMALWLCVLALLLELALRRCRDQLVDWL